MAKSLLEALIEMISNASVTFEILILLRSFKERFLELVKTTTPMVNASEQGGQVATKEEIEESLNERIEEIEEFQAVKVRVLSFARMCDLIQPGEICKKDYLACGFTPSLFNSWVTDVFDWLIDSLKYVYLIT